MHHELVQKGYVVAEVLQPTEEYPNNTKLPLLIYKGALLIKPKDSPKVVMDLFSKNGYIQNWVGDVFTEDHFHANTHEVVAVFSGQAEIVFGGEKCLEVYKGDVLIIPAGIAYKKRNSSADFECVGAYPDTAKLIPVKEKGKGLIDSGLICMVPVKDPVYGNDASHLNKYWCTNQAHP